MKRYIAGSKTIEPLFLLGAFVVLAVGLLLPKSGPNVLVDDFFEILLWWIIWGYAFCKIVMVRNSGIYVQKCVRVIIVIAGLLLCMWGSRNIVSDVIVGTEEMVLRDVGVSRYQGFAGALSVHYFLVGEDNEGNSCRFELSKNDYSKYKNARTVMVVYYPNTERVVEIVVKEG